MQCEKYDDAFSTIDLKSLTDFGVSIRYADDFYLPEVSETKEYINIAKDIKVLVESLIR